MKPILAIETATRVCSAAVLRGDSLSERSTDGDRQHDAALLGMVDQVLAEAGVARWDLDAVAVSAGPGSYTGLRIGVSVAKAVVEALGIRLVAVPSLVAAALASGQEGLLLATFPSRRAEIFAALVQVGSDSAVQVGKTMSGQPAEIWKEAGARLAVGPGADRFAPEVPRRVTACSAATVARVGAWMRSDGEFADPELFEPYYLKSFVAGTPTRSAFARLPF